MAGYQIVESIRHLVDYAALAIELLAVVVIITAVVVVVVSRGPLRHTFRAGKGGAEERYVQHLGRPLMLALDLLVAGDLVKTVALEPALNNVAALGLLVLVRTFLSWSLAVEIEGHWPWQAKSKSDHPE